jgi:hypothetical protein
MVQLSPDTPAGINQDAKRSRGSSGARRLSRRCWGGAYRGGVAVGPRGGVAVCARGGVVVARRPVLVGGRVYRPYGAWWRPGGAIVAGAAVGFVAAASTAAYAGAPPAPNYCWYYTDATKHKGFWDACPQ